MTDPAAIAPAPRLIRWWGLILFLAAVLLLLVILPFAAQRWADNAIRDRLAANGWRLRAGNDISVSVYRGTISGHDLVLEMIQARADGQHEEVARIGRLNAELAIGECMAKRDVVIAELAAEGLSGNLRRGPDGRIATIPADGQKSGPGFDWHSVDWGTWYRKGMEKLKERKANEERQRQEQEQREKDRQAGKQPQPVPEEERPPAEPDVEWPKAVRYQPLPTGDRHTPRVVIRRLAASGTAIRLPDETPFEVTAFRIDGSNVSLRQDVGETMELKGSATTKGAGDVSFALVRRPDDSGSLTLAAPAVPMEALAHPAVGGASLAAWGPTGNAAILSDQRWTGWALDGSTSATLSALHLAPRNADTQGRRIAGAINALKGKPIVWPLRNGGTLLAPTITDTGVETVMKGELLGALTAAATEEAKDKAAERATGELDKLLEKNGIGGDAAKPVKDAVGDGAKGAAGSLLNGLLGK